MESTIRYVRVRKEDAKFFSYLDPYEKLRLLDLPIGFAMGVLEDKDDTTRAVGLLVAAVSDETIIIEWMAVDPDHRFRGIGDELLYRMFMIAADSKMDSISVAIMPEYEKEKLLKRSTEFFAERLFTAEQPIGGDADISIAELKEALFLKKVTKPQTEILQLSSFTGKERCEYISRLAAIDNASYTFSPEIIAPMIDADISLVCRNGSSVEGGLIVCVTGDTLWPMYHYSKNEMLSEAMMYGAIVAAEKKYGPNMNVTLLMRQEGVSELASKVLGYEPTGTLLTADVSRFKEESAEEDSYG